jgi:hypothetical protein
MPTCSRVDSDSKSNKLCLCQKHQNSLLVKYCSFFPEDAVGQTQAWMPTYVSILRIAHTIWVWRATVEWYCQGKSDELGEKPVPVPLCPPQIPHGLTRTRTRTSDVRGRRLTTWVIARPFRIVLLQSNQTLNHRLTSNCEWWNMHRGFN